MAKKFDIEKLLQKKTLTDITKKIEEGWTERMLAEHFGVSKTTFSKYKQQEPKLANAIFRGYSKTIKEVVNALFMAAKGYYKEETKTYKVRDKESGEWVETKKEVLKKWYPPKEKAMTFYLLNKDPDNWTNQEKAAMEVIVQGVDTMSPKQLQDKLENILKSKA